MAPPITSGASTWFRITNTGFMIGVRRGPESTFQVSCNPKSCRPNGTAYSIWGFDLVPNYQHWLHDRSASGIRINIPKSAAARSHVVQMVPPIASGASTWFRITNTGFMIGVRRGSESTFQVSCNPKSCRPNGTAYSIWGFDLVPNYQHWLHDRSAPGIRINILSQLQPEVMSSKWHRL
jgi:hypothetical protein